MKKSKNEGITLVALIVTIIILLILAGVTIALLSGEDGILSRTEKAATSYQIESIKEVVNLKLANLNASKWIDEGRSAVLKDLNELDDENSSNFDTEISLKSSVGDSDTSAILIYDKHEVEVNSSLNIAKVDGANQEGVSGGTSGGSGSDESGSTGGGSSIDSAEYAQMQATIAQLQQKVATLEEQSATKTELGTEMATANDKINSNREQIENMLTTLDVDTRTTLFEGTAGTKGQTYTISDISEFKYLIVYADIVTSGNSTHRTSSIINVNDIIYNSGNTPRGTQTIALIGSSTYYYSIVCEFRNSKELYIRNIEVGGWENPRIYKIEAIK